MRQVITSSTDQTIVFYAYDSDGVAVDLDSGSAGLTLAYRIDQNGREGTPVSLTPVARLTANVHRDGAITSRGDGKHEVDLPDAAFATNQSIVTVEVDTTDADVFFAERIVVDSTVVNIQPSIGIGARDVASDVIEIATDAARTISRSVVDSNNAPVTLPSSCEFVITDSNKALVTKLTPTISGSSYSVTLPRSILKQEQDLFFALRNADSTKLDFDSGTLRVVYVAFDPT